jgi:hypothetical protein
MITVLYWIFNKKKVDGMGIETIILKKDIILEN